MRASCARMYAAELRGIDARIVEVEIDIRVGLHSFVIVGLADKALNEARERVSVALGRLGVKPPHRENRKITVNLAPAAARKTGSCYDLAIALGYLVASGQLRVMRAERFACVGELALDGRLRAVRGALSIADCIQRSGISTLLMPEENAHEAAAIAGVRIVPLKHLSGAVDFLRGEKEIAPLRANPVRKKTRAVPDFADIRGQAHAKRAAVIAAAGGHNILLHGPPGIGKSMLAQALSGILPSLTSQESITVTKIYSAAGMLRSDLIKERPFRMPHQTSSLPALLGGGPEPVPGELSLAHGGVLFLDELAEFPRHVLDALREPVESKVVRLARAKQRVVFPANFMLVAAMNPCPCGFRNDPRVPCACTARQIAQYGKKISGPFLDRIDIVVRMERPRTDTFAHIESIPAQDEHGGIRSVVCRARAVQEQRGSLNSCLTSHQLRTHARLNHGAQAFLRQADLLRVSPRGYYRLIKTARTIADIEGERDIHDAHLAEAYTYRFRDQLT